MRELGGASEAAVLGIKHLEGGFHDLVNHPRGKIAAAAGKRLRLRERALDQLGLLHHIAILLLVSVGDGLQNALEAGASVALVGRKIGSSVEGLALGSEKSSKWPASLPADGAHRHLITAVNIGALITIHLHRHEALIHLLRDFGIVIGFAIHDVAPVAPV